MPNSAQRQAFSVLQRPKVVLMIQRCLWYGQNIKILQKYFEIFLKYFMNLLLRCSRRQKWSKIFWKHLKIFWKYLKISLKYFENILKIFQCHRSQWIMRIIFAFETTQNLVSSLGYLNFEYFKYFQNISKYFQNILMP